MVSQQQVYAVLGEQVWEVFRLPHDGERYPRVEEATTPPTPLVCYPWSVATVISHQLQ